MKDGNDKFWDDLLIALVNDSDEYLDEEVDDDYFPDLDFEDEPEYENINTEDYKKILEEENE